MREWIVTNGLGSYASLTHSNTNTRKFHGLLVASLEPPTKRWMFVSNIFDKVHVGNTTYDLANLKHNFFFDFHPSFTYDIDGTHIKKTIFMPYGKNTTILKYDISPQRSVSLVHELFVNFRHFYDVTDRDSISYRQHTFDHGITINGSTTDKTLTFLLRNALYNPVASWAEFQYEVDKQRNDSWKDSTFYVGDFYKTIDRPLTYYLMCTLEPNLDMDPSILYAQEIERKKHLLEQAELSAKFEKLILSADSFIVKKGEGKSIVAGYHWFGDWGRDTLIAFPGLTLVTKRFADGKEILLNFGKFCKKGLIPNAFMDRDSKAVYNTVDASLWFIDRVYQYVKYTDDRALVEKLWSSLDSIIYHYKNGTDYHIHMDHDYLINHGPGLTWMDVKLGDYYPTPRAYKAVEIQALWYNALRIMAIFSSLLGKDDVYSDIAEKAKQHFNDQYDGLYDVIDIKDASLRPNMIFLVSLDFTMIGSGLQEAIVQEAEDKLLTIFGPRTLSPNNPRYKGSYFGDYHRDVAYHNGTVWPWLVGPFIKAYVKVKNYNSAWREVAFKKFLLPMFEVSGDSWDGFIYEIFDGDPPHLPHGCIAQAWSVAEILRCWVEDIENITPQYAYDYLHKISV